MGGEGSILAMIISEKNNRNLLKNRRKFFNKDKLEDRSVNYHMAMKDKSVSRAKLMSIRGRMQEDNRRASLRLILALITAAGISLILILLVAHYFI